MATFRNNKKKDWFSHETGLVVVHGEVFLDGSRNFALFKMELVAKLVTVGFATKGQCLHVAAVILSSLLAKLKLNENSHVLKAYLFCRHVFTFFRKR